MQRFRSSPSSMRSIARGRQQLPQRSAGGTLIGVFVGLVLGIVIAGSVALYVTGGWKAYTTQVASGGRESRDREPLRTGAGASSDKAASDKPRFDFYKILPGGEEAKIPAPPAPSSPDRAVADKAVERAPVRPPETLVSPPKAETRTPDVAPDVAKVATGERFWLQAGSFSTPGDAENLRARLALAGWEANLQQGVLPDKAVRYRVRLGPYDNVDELNRIKGELARRGFDVAVIRY